jgi:DNA (cytosine-5)-methyltransferase 1
MLRLNDWFCGAGGATQGAHQVPGVVPVLAANHDQLAIDTHSTNFPDVEHFRGDIRDLDVAGHPYAEIFWASPECTNWSQAKGKAVDFDGRQQPGLFGDPEIADDVARSRALMQDVIRYLEGMDLRQQPVLAGVVENVTDIRKWEHWHAWRSRIERLGYRTRLIALNSMHAQSRWTPRAPQSRDRLYLAYWHTKIGRDPDWDRWLRPSAHCPTCDRDVAAVQSWKKPGIDMGRYRTQYVYRCPTVSCRGQIVEPVFVPAAAAIDWTLPGERIGDRKKPLAAKTLARIEAGIAKYARPIILEAAGHTFERRPGVRTRPMDRELTTQHTTLAKGLAVPMLVPAGGTWNDTGQPLTEAMRTRTTRETDGVLVPPLLVPVEGREGKQAAPAGDFMRTQTARNETGLLIPPFLAQFRQGTERRIHDLREPLPTIVADGGNSGMVVPPFITELWGTAKTRPIGRALATVSAEGNHHFLTVPQATMAAWAALYGYDGGQFRDHTREPLPTQTTVQGDGILSGAGLPAVEDCLFRMLEPHEIHAGMAFVPDYIVLGNKRQKVKQLGNAVTPPVAEVLVSALVECISGEAVEDLEEAA